MPLAPRRILDGFDRRFPSPRHSCAPMKVVVVAVLITIVVALFSALFFMYQDRGRGTRMLKALTIRVALSIALVAFLLLSYWMGWIAPQGLR